MPVPGDNFAVTRSNDPNAEIIAADALFGGVKVQRVKTGWGPDGTLYDTTLATPLPVQVPGTISVEIMSGVILEDADAIHDNVAAEISAIAEKVTPAAGDWLIIEDSAAGFAKKKIKISSVGEVNTGANIGVDGVGVFDSKSGATLQFRNVAPANASMTTVLNGADIDLDVAAATESLAGKIEIATQAETNAGLDDVRAVTPLKLATTSLAGRDTTAFHNNSPNEINALTSKATPVAADEFVIESAADLGAKRKVTLAALLTGLGLGTAGQATATGAISTTSLTDVLVTGMTLTPGAGTYLAMFSMTMAHNKTGQTVFASMYANGVQQASTDRDVGGQAGNLGNGAFQRIVTVGAGQAIEARWRVSSNAGGGQGSSPGPRTLTLVKLA